MSREALACIAPLQRWGNLDDPNEVLVIDHADRMRWVVRDGSGLREMPGGQICREYRYESGSSLRTAHTGRRGRSVMSSSPSVW
jgi:hypothetical protein